MCVGLCHGRVSCEQIPTKKQLSNIIHAALSQITLGKLVLNDILAGTLSSIRYTHILLKGTSKIIFIY